eukprot:UN00425
MKEAKIYLELLEHVSPKETVLFSTNILTDPALGCGEGHYVLFDETLKAAEKIRKGNLYKVLTTINNIMYNWLRNEKKVVEVDLKIRYVQIVMDYYKKLTDEKQEGYKLLIGLIAPF